MKINAIDLVSVEDTAPGATTAVFPAVTGDSLVVRSTARRAMLLALWSNFQASGFWTITSPRLHDTTLGIQHSAPVGLNEYRVPIIQELEPQDTLTSQGQGSATAGDIEQASMLIAYEGLSGVDGNFITDKQLESRAAELYTPLLTLGSTGVAGGYSGSEGIASDQNAMKANELYAILGAVATVAAGSISSFGFVGPDWGNLRVGCPGYTTGRNNGATWFYDLARRTGLPVIPVFNSSNRDVTTIDILKNEVANTPIVAIYMARLKRSAGK